MRSAGSHEPAAAFYDDGDTWQAPLDEGNTRRLQRLARHVSGRSLAKRLGVCVDSVYRMLQGAPVNARTRRAVVHYLGGWAHAAPRRYACASDPRELSGCEDLRDVGRAEYR